MVDGQPWRLVMLNQRERRAWHIPRNTEGPQHRARQSGLAGAKIARKRHRVAGF